MRKTLPILFAFSLIGMLNAFCPMFAAGALLENCIRSLEDESRYAEAAELFRTFGLLSTPEKAGTLRRQLAELQIQTVAVQTFESLVDRTSQRSTHSHSRSASSACNCDSGKYSRGSITRR